MMSFALLVVLVLAYAVGKRFGLCGRDRSKSQQRKSLRRLQPVTRKSDRPNKERGVFTTDPAGNPLPFKYGFADNVGLRDHMEDRHSVSGNITGDVSKCFIGVYDGHGGSGASTFCSENMRRFLENSLRQERDPEEALTRHPRADEEYCARRGRWNDTCSGSLPWTEIICGKCGIRGQSLSKGRHCHRHVI